LDRVEDVVDRRDVGRGLTLMYPMRASRLTTKVPRHCRKPELVLPMWLPERSASISLLGEKAA
jgi:hypothetical protein